MTASSPALRKARWLTATLFVVGVWAAPAASAHDPEVGFDPAVPALFTSAPAISGFGAHDGIGDNDMDRVEVSYDRRQSNQLASCQLPSSAVFLPESDPGRIEVASTPELNCNGRYRVVLTAVTRGTPAVHNVASKTVLADFDVAMPPSTPVGLSTKVDVGARRITIDWADNAEVDLIGYAVFRKGPGETQARAIDAVTDSRYVDVGATQAGSYRYEIQAIRMGPSQDPESDDVVFSGVATTSASQSSPTTTTSSGSTGQGGGGTTETTAYVITPPGQNASPPLVAGSNQASLDRLRRQAAANRAVPDVEVDTGFDETLPFDLSGRPAGDGEAALASARHEVFVEVHDRRAALAPIAGGLVLFLGAVHLRMMSRRLHALDVTG